MRDRERFLDLDGARLRIRESGAGPAVVLVHGWALDSDMWTAQFAELSRDYHVIAFDRRAFGLSSGEPSIAADSADLRVILDLLDVQRASLVGMSQGARAVLHFAQNYRAQVACIVLDGPPSVADLDAISSGEIPIARYRDILGRYGIEAFRREWQEHALMQLQSKDPATRARLRAIIERYPAKDLLLSHAGQVGPRIEWSTLRVPMLVINGEHDTTARLEAGRTIVALTPGASHALIPNSGHLPNLDNSPEYNDVLREFLDKHATAKTHPN